MRQEVGYKMKKSTIELSVFVTILAAESSVLCCAYCFIYCWQKEQVAENNKLQSMWAFNWRQASEENSSTLNEPVHDLKVNVQRRRVLSQTKKRGNGFERSELEKNFQKARNLFKTLKDLLEQIRRRTKVAEVSLDILNLKKRWRIRLCLTSRKKTFHSASRSEWRRSKIEEL